MGAPSVYGFFFLSAFLLTCRLLHEFESVQSSKMCLLKILQYGIRRFFRIYLVFIIFWAITVFGHPLFRPFGPQITYTNFSDGLMLRFLGRNHLWTMPVEIPYYFYIPVICFLVFKSGRHGWLPFCIILEAIVFFNQNLYLKWFIRKYHIFLHGSVFGIVHVKLKDTNHIQKLMTFSSPFFSSVVTLLIKSLSFIVLTSLFFIQFYAKTIKYGHFSTISIMICLLYADRTSPIMQLFSTYVMRKCGQFSFGMYLFHRVVSQAYLNIQLENHHGINFFYEIVFIHLISTFFIGLIWFYLVENIMIKVANQLCIKLNTVGFFQEKSFNLINIENEK